MAKRRKPKLLTDAVVSGCLERIRRGNVLAAGVLADRLDETGHPLARRVRRLWKQYAERRAYWESYDFSRCRRWTRWEMKAWDSRNLRERIAILFGRKWRLMPLKAFYEGVSG